MKNQNSNLRVGVFGGTFNPIHNGHVNSLLTVADIMKLDKIIVVPANQNPHRQPLEGPTAQQRFDMVKTSLAKYQDFIEVDDQELRRGGLSYTFDTLKNLSETYSPEQLFLIIGFDQFESFEKWKKFEKILSMANLIVTSRPDAHFPRLIEQMPQGLRPLVGLFDFPLGELTTGRSIHFVQLEDVDVSATQVRKKIRLNQNIDNLIPREANDFIREHHLYQSIGPKIGSFEDFAKFCGEVLLDRKGIQVRLYDVRALNTSTEYNLIASGTSTRHAAALGDVLIREVKDKYAVLPQSVEGTSEGRWVLIDYGSLIVHVFYDFVRQEYRLEELWKPGNEIQLNEKK